ncbi:MAG: Panacea domain-containing protein [Scytonema sp. PMC 1069.18]|nr:Panacea domain-containing protein [Scytonema sp. PMC 1069.18]MEC4882008.1 Panacea domain-containing protein [Scytonema sp. PMC 1070.18]
MLKPDFQESKAVQAAAILLKLRGGKMSYMKLIKLLYLVDREALLRWGRPVTYDSYVSMRHGPVLSEVLDRISEGDPPGVTSIWNQYISEPRKYEVELKQDCPPDDLSEAEEQLICEIFNKFGHNTRWELVELLHEVLPEWKNPGNSSIPIEYHDILKAGGKTEMEAREIESEIESVALMNSFLSNTDDMLSKCYV